MYDFIKTIISALQEWTKKEIKKNIKSVAIDMPSNIATTEDIQEAVNTINEDMQETVNIINEDMQAAVNTINDMQNTVDGKMDKENPAGTGSFSMNRRSGETVGAYSHAVGYSTIASGDYSHAEGNFTRALGKSSHAEGGTVAAHGNALYHPVVASGESSHAEGSRTEASGDYSHAEGGYTTASGTASHAEGYETTASGKNSHAEGNSTTASGKNSHSEGVGTKASGENQHVQGKYNKTNADYAHIVGNGESDTERSNAHTLDWEGNAWYAGDVYVGGTGQDYGEKLATEEYVNTAIANNSVDGAVLYTEQELTAEQRAQVRENISLYRGTWYTVSNPSMQVADYNVLKFGNDPSFDMEAALNKPSEAFASWNILGNLVHRIDGITRSTTEASIKSKVKQVVTDLDALYNSNILTNNLCALAKRNKDAFPTEIELAFYAENKGGNFNGTFPYTHYIDIQVGKRTGQIYYNANTEECVTALTLYQTTDTTLAEKGFAADAKAVGDALANHTHDDKYYTEAEVDALIASVANNEVFVITVTKGEDGKYSADKTYDEVYDAYINKKELSVRYNGDGYDGIYPLSFYDGDSPIPGFSFDLYSVNNKRAQRQMISVTANGVSHLVAEFSQERITTVNTNSTLTTTDKTLVGAINEINEKVSNTESVEIPETLPNPHKLIFTGAVTAEYDGSEDVTVDVPAGGGDGENWTLISDETLTEDVAQYTKTFDSMYRVFIVFDTPANDSAGKVNVRLNAAPETTMTNLQIYKTFATQSELYMTRPSKTVLKNIENLENGGFVFFSSIPQSSSNYQICNGRKDITQIDIFGQTTIYADTRIRIYGEAW